MKQICKKCFSINEVKSDVDDYNCTFCKHKNKVIPQNNLIIEKYFPKANSLLCEKTKYKDSYYLFKSLHKLNPSNISIYFGVIFSLLYQSDFHKSFLKEANEFLINESENISLNKKETLSLGKYLSDYFNDIKNYSIKLEEFYIYKNKIFAEGNKKYLLENVKNQIIIFEEFYLKLFDQLGELSLYLKDPKESIEKDLLKNKNKTYETLEIFSNDEKNILLKEKKLKKEKTIFLDNKSKILIKNSLKIISGFFLIVAFVFMFFLLNDDLKVKYPWTSLICLLSLSLFIILFFIITQIKLKKNFVKEEK